MTLKRDDILKAQDIKTEKVNIPEWGGDIYVKELTGEERNEYESFLIDLANGKKAHKMDEARSRLAVLSICDEEGKRLFTDDDIKALSRKNAKALMRVYGVAQRLSLIGQDQISKETESLQADPFVDSPSD